MSDGKESEELRYGLPKETLHTAAMFLGGATLICAGAGLYVAGLSGLMIGVGTPWTASAGYSLYLQYRQWRAKDVKHVQDEGAPGLPD